MEEQDKIKKKKLYDKHYKTLLLIPGIILVVSLVYMGIFINQTGDFIRKDVTLTGGTTITVFTSEVNIDLLGQTLSNEFDDFLLREISNLRTGNQEGFMVEVNAQPSEIKPLLENFLGYKLDDDNSSVEFTGASLSQSFYNQLRTAIVFAFILMSIVVFIIFKKAIVSLIVILSAFADIVMSLALVNFIGFKISTAGIVAFLMLIGYSVDSDIMLTTKVIKQRAGSINSRIFSAFKTGMTMGLTSIVAILVALIITTSFSDVLRQIFLILLIGLSFDLINTWITNASLLKWYQEGQE